MEKDTNEWKEVCVMLNKEKEKRAKMTPEELEEYDKKNEENPVVAGWALA